MASVVDVTPPAVTVAPDIAVPVDAVTMPSIVPFTDDIDVDVGSIGAAIVVGVGVGPGADISAKSWVVTLFEVTTTPAVVFIRYPVALAVTLYVPGSILML